MNHTNNPNAPSTGPPDILEPVLHFPNPPNIFSPISNVPNNSYPGIFASANNVPPSHDSGNDTDNDSSNVPSNDPSNDFSDIPNHILDNDSSTIPSIVPSDNPGNDFSNVRNDAPSIVPSNNFGNVLSSVYPSNHRNLDITELIITRFSIGHYASEPIRVAVLSWSGMNLVELAAPLEVFSQARNARDERIFRIYMAGPEKSHATDSAIVLGNHIDLNHFLSNLTRFGLLIIPGGTVQSGDTARWMTPAIRAWATVQVPSGQFGPPHYLLSTGAGALFVAGAGLLGGLRATTSPLNMHQLRAWCHGRPVQVVTDPWADTNFFQPGAGPNIQILRIVTSSKGANGFEGAYHLLEVICGGEVMQYTRQVVDVN